MEDVSKVEKGTETLQSNVENTSNGKFLKDMFTQCLRQERS